jgi:hypothetical protein
MSLRPPSFRSSATRAPAHLLDDELAQEKAAALGRLGRALEAALAAMHDFDAAEAAAATPQRARRRLVAEAGQALWLFIVQREACGLRDARQVLRDYRVPPEVYERMGAMPERAPMAVARKYR